MSIHDFWMSLQDHILPSTSEFLEKAFGGLAGALGKKGGEEFWKRVTEKPEKPILAEETAATIAKISEVGEIENNLEVKEELFYVPYSDLSLTLSPWERRKESMKNQGWKECKEYDDCWEFEFDDINDDIFNIENEYVQILSFLPTLNKNRACGAIVFGIEKLEDITFTFDHLSVLQTYFKTYKMSLESRGFISLYKGEYYCDIGTTRIVLQEKEIQSLCDNLDRLWEKYKERLLMIENTWKSSDFEILDGFGDHVPLIEIEQELWFLLLDFTHHHNSINNEYSIQFAKCHAENEKKWTIFDSHGQYIQVFTKETLQYNQGHHVFISTKQQNSGKMLLLWQPPYNSREYNNEFSLRNYWDIETTYNWLLDELIPYASFWKKNIYRCPKLIQKVKRASYKDFVKKYRLKNAHTYRKKFRQGLDELIFLVQELQIFYSSRRICDFSINEHKCLYRALYLSLEHSKCDKYHSYLRDNLSFKSENITELKQSIQDKIEEITESLCNSSKIDFVLRSILCCLTSESYLNEYEIGTITSLLQTFLARKSDADLIERQISRIT